MTHMVMARDRGVFCGRVDSKVDAALLADDLYELEFYLGHIDKVVPEFFSLSLSELFSKAASCDCRRWMLLLASS